MPIDKHLEDRLHDLLQAKKITSDIKHMFGGSAFIIRGNMAIGIMHDGKLMARVGKEKNEAALKMPGAQQMNMHKPMVGYIVVEPMFITTDKQLEKWLDICLEYNSSLPIK